ncbi:hypothetical protein B0H13DRAFT_1910721 [Mycena leptocephala]|nr:hypothetical protein B0H13DRAFT_1910721 [Mycena leptocephala]
MASLGNINELIFQGLSDDETSLLGIVNSIFTLKHFSTVMLRGPSPFMERIRDLAEANNIPWLKWRYRCGQLRGDSVSPRWTSDVEVWINEGDFTRAIRFNDSALSLGKQTTDINLILTLLESSSRIANSMHDYCSMLGVVKEARALAPLTWSTRLEIDWLYDEASANFFLGNLPRARELSERGYEQNIWQPQNTIVFWVKAQLDLHNGHLQSARSGFEECLTKSLGISPDLPALCLAVLGDPRHKMDTAQKTFRWAMIYLAAVRKSKDLVATFHALRCLADIFAIFGNEGTALNLFHAALHGATKIDIHRLRAECMDKHGRSKENVGGSHPAFHQILPTKDAAAIEAHLAKLTLAQDHQEVRIDYPALVTDLQTTANEEESKKMAQPALFSAPQKLPLSNCGRYNV